MKIFCRSISFLCLLFVLISTRTYAITGGEITYLCLGNSRYEVTVRVYWDCHNPALVNNPLIVTPLGSGSATSYSLTQYSVRDITANGCSSLQSYCAGGSFSYGVEEYFFKTTIDLSAYTSSCKFTLGYDNCCRSNAITTGLAGTHLYLEALLDNCLSSCNSSPQFTRQPDVILCVGVDYSYNSDVIDTIDGDSISYSLVDAMTAAGTNVAYASGYSKNRPLMFLGSPFYNSPLPDGFHLDSISGELRFRPTKVEIGVIVVKATEWRKISGTMTIIGEVRREMTFIVTVCNATKNNKLPVVSGPYVYLVCAGKQTCFNIQSTDPDAGDTVRITWNKGIPDATFTSSFPSGSNKQVGTFCWTPTDSDASTTPYYFSAIVKDNFCPQPASSSKTFSVQVRPSLKNSGRVFSNMGCGKVLFTATPGDSGISQYKWTIRKGTTVTLTNNANTFSYIFPVGGTYFVDLDESRAGYCGLKYSDTLNVDTFLMVKLPSDTTLCRGSALTINSVVSSGKKPYRYQWSSASNDTLPAVNLTIKATTNYYLTVTDSGHCAISDTMKVTSKAPFVNAGSDKTICITNGIQLLSGIPSGGNWAGVAVSGSSFDPALAATGSHKLIYSFTDSGGCANSDTMVFSVFANPVVFAGNDTAVCKNKQLTLTGSPQNGTWKMGSGIIGNVFNPISFNTGPYTLTYNYTDGNGCFANDSIIINVKPVATVDAGADTSLCAGGGSFPLVGIPAGGSWSGPGTSGNIFDPTGLSGFKTITYLYVDSNGCGNTDTRGITINTLPAVDAGNDRNVCLDAGNIQLKGTPATGTWTGTGITNGIFNPASAGKGSHKAWYTISNPNGCSATDSILLTVVKPIADFSATPLTGNRPLTVGFTNLSSGNFQQYEWNFGDAASGQNTSGLQNPSHKYTRFGLYSVKLKITDTTISCMDTLFKVNYISVSPGVGVVEINGSKGVFAYPNPASKIFDVLLNIPGEELFTLVMHDITGKKVKELSRVKSGISHVNCEDLQAGMYFITVSGSDGELYKTRVVLE